MIQSGSCPICNLTLADPVLNWRDIRECNHWLNSGYKVSYSLEQGTMVSKIDNTEDWLYELIFHRKDALIYLDDERIAKLLLLQ